MLKNKKIAVVGATGKVGREALVILQEYGVPRTSISAVASPRSAGKLIQYADGQIEVSSLESVDFPAHDIAIFSAGSEVSKTVAPIAVARGCIVIDNTSYFRMRDDVPLIVPEVNFGDLEKYGARIVANPNCSTIQMVMALKPLHDVFGLKEAVVSTYQSVSGAGQRGVEELALQVENSRNNEKNEKIEPRFFKKQIAFNVIPQIDDFADMRYTKEELKMMNETKKILNIGHLEITATCVRVPVFVGHAMSVFARFEANVNIEVAQKALREFNGVEVADNGEYTTPVENAGSDAVFVSRLRGHPTQSNALSFWCVADNLRKGAALNAIQIADRL